MTYVSIRFLDSAGREYYCLLEPEKIIVEGRFDLKHIFIKRVLNPDNDVVGFKEIESKLYWYWKITEENLVEKDLIECVRTRDAEIVDLEDDESALLWFKLNYGV